METKSSAGASEVPGTSQSRAGYVYTVKTTFWNHGQQFVGHEPAVLAPGQVCEPLEHWESAASKHRAHVLLDVSDSLGAFARVEPRPARREEILRFHTAEYLARLEELNNGMGGETGSCAPMGPKTLPLAELSAGACIAGAEAILASDVDTCYVLTRPPGHHAERDRGMGFCIFGNVALAVKAVQEACKSAPAAAARTAAAAATLESSAPSLKDAPVRVVILDLDVHHGNGTQQAFWDDPDVLFISLHQHGLYPRETGYVDDAGGEGARGRTINLPLPAGSGNGAYLHATRRVVVPAIQAFTPDLLVLSMGFDAGSYDPLGRMSVSTSGFADVVTEVLRCCEKLLSRLPVLPRSAFGTRTLPSTPARSSAIAGAAAAAAAAPCLTRTRFPVLACHEGGYSAQLVPYALAAVMDRMLCYTRGALPPVCSAWCPEADPDGATQAACLLASDGLAKEDEANLGAACKYSAPPEVAAEARWGVGAGPLSTWPYKLLPLSDPFHEELSTVPFQALQRSQASVIELVRKRIVEGMLFPGLKSSRVRSTGIN